ncbi:MAG: hypothetical protein IPG07_10520 [Crocinitomicaceae bacterium]|nr:hypothetical protein [Crocinitomicaceae bacterium]
MDHVNVDQADKSVTVFEGDLNGSTDQPFAGNWVSRCRLKVTHFVLEENLNS